MKLIFDNTTLKKTNNSFTTKPLFFQPKLTVNQPNDVYEQEAEMMADKVMRMTDPVAKNDSFFKYPISSLQRKCTHCEQEEKELQRKETDHDILAISSQTENYINSLSGGKRLSENERRFFDSRMNYDFSGVRLHTDNVAAETAQSVNALAYTSGNNIVFNNGRYAPQTFEGKKLLAHELTHVVQQSHDSVRTKIQKDEDETAGTATSAPPVPAIHEAVNELNYAFVFAGGAYGNAAEAFIRQYNPDHILIKANSFEAMMDRLYTDVSRHIRGQRNHVQEIIIVTHANAAGGMQIPLARNDAQRHRFFTPWDLSQLQTDFRHGLFSRFRQRRSDVVSAAIDENTSVVVRGCEFGQSQQALDALRTFFGGQPHVWAPTAFQGYETVPVNNTSFLHTPEEAFDFLVQQDFLPAELQPAPDEERRQYIARVFHMRRIPTEFFVVGQEAHDQLNSQIHAGRGMSPEAEQYKHRQDVGVPGGEMWGSSFPSMMGSDTELDGLTREQLEARAEALSTPYDPRNAAMLRRLSQAWERVVSHDLSYILQDNPDPLFGLPPEEIFGDSNIIAMDAARYGGAGPVHADEFETTTLPSIEATAQQIANSQTFDNELEVSPNEAQDNVPVSNGAASQLPSPSATSPSLPQVTSGSGTRRSTQEIMNDLRLRGGDFSKSHNVPPTQQTVHEEIPTVTPVTTPEPQEAPFELPGITRQFSTLESVGVELLFDINPAFLPLIQAAKLLTTATNTTVGIGIQGGANAVAGVSPGGGIVIRGGRIVALYGALGGNVGVAIGLSLELQVTIIRGSMNNFTGESVSTTVGGGEALVGHASLILNTNREVIGVSVSGGIGAGLTAIEAYISYQGTAAPLH